MRVGSVCSGIEAATAAWRPLGWEFAFYSEIEKFPRAVLAHHYPETPIHHDFTTIGDDEYGAIDLLAGGTPCQDFSVAGLRAGITGARGGLTLEFVRMAARKKPRWVVWENVPGVLSIDGGRAFGAFLAGLGQCGYGVAYRILDAQHFGVPQRRRRVFVIGYLGDWRPAAAVFFESESLRGDPAPCRASRQDVAPTISARTKGGGELGTDFDCDGGLIPELAWALQERDYKGQDSNTKDGHLIPVSFESRYARNGRGAPSDIVPPLKAQSGETGKGDGAPLLLSNMAVRRLTPRECERLQGFPDDYTLVPYRGRPAKDGPRYKALGNSMAVPCMAWLGDRIQKIESLINPESVKIS